MQLIRAGAPREMMQKFFGMSTEMYTHARELHGAQAQRGRPKMVEGSMQGQVYQEFVRQYYRYGGGYDPLRQPRFFLDMYENLGGKIPIRELWTLAQEWVRTKTVFEQAKRQARAVSCLGGRMPRMTPRSNKEDSASKPPASTFSEGT